MSISKGEACNSQSLRRCGRGADRGRGLTRARIALDAQKFHPRGLPGVELCHRFEPLTAGAQEPALPQR